ncbi:MAG: ribose ABC transporter [Rhodobacteraceae bacterium]|nr:ribose ABC transporter [Paracoccaceae bacterium]
MLKGLDHRLNAEVLYALRAMGHGDTLAIVDTNFPAETAAKTSTFGRLLRMENLTAAEAAEAVLSLLPLDTFVPDFAMRMQVVGAPAEVPPVQAEVQAVIGRVDGQQSPMVGIERFAFYEEAKKAFAIVQTGERRFYGCVIFRKGVMPPTL